MSRAATRLLALAAGLAVLVGTATPVHAIGVAAARSGARTAPITRVQAASGAQIALWQQRAKEAIDRRRLQLDRLSDAIRRRAFVTAPHRGGLLQQIAAAKQGLASLGAAIAAERDPARLRGEIPRIVSDFRVYVLVTPKVRLVLAADGGAAVAARLDRVAARLAGAIDRARRAGRDTTAAAAALTGLRRALTAARAELAGIADSVLPLTAAGLPANRGTLEAAAAHLGVARDELHQAVASARAAVDALRALR